MPVIICGQATPDPKEYYAGNPEFRDYVNLETYQIEELSKLYYKFISTPKDIINGKECLPYSFRGKTTAYLFTRDKLNTTLIVNNRPYRNIRLQYDTFKDEIVYVDTSRIINFEFPRIALNKDIIEGFSFTWNGSFYNFRHLRFLENSDRKLNDGFYEVAYEGSATFIIRHTSSFYSKEGLSEYKYSPERYISVEGKYYRIKNKKDFLKLFTDRSLEIRDYLRKNGIKVRKATREQIVDALKIFDSQKNAGRIPG
jgi:hypothetical protein